MTFRAMVLEPANAILIFMVDAIQPHRHMLCRLWRLCILNIKYGWTMATIGYIHLVMYEVSFFVKSWDKIATLYWYE